MEKRESGRRHDIDWLRNLAFLLLIFYHIGMYYVSDWGWHIKSQETFSWLKDVMILTNPWRMSLLFFLSAMALALVQKKYSGLQLCRIRAQRLIIPLLFGMFVLVVPQVYIEALSQGLINPGYQEFWAQYINPNTDLLREYHTPIGLLTWAHLWFLPYLFIYSVVAVLLIPILNRFAELRVVRDLPLWVCLSVLVLAYTLILQNLRDDFPETHALTDDWFNHARYFLVFLSGYIVVKQSDWWERIIGLRFLMLIVALCTYAFLIIDRNAGFGALGGMYQTSVGVRTFYNLVASINHWAWIFACLGLAGAYLRKPSKRLIYANHAILPWYMFHQTIIIMLAWLLLPYSLDPLLEFFIILLGTVSGCVIGYELVKRFSITRVLFGLKPISGAAGPPNEGCLIKNQDDPNCL